MNHGASTSMTPGLPPAARHDCTAGLACSLDDSPSIAGSVQRGGLAWTAPQSPNIAMLLPCYNEEAAIAATVAGFRAALPVGDDLRLRQQQPRSAPREVAARGGRRRPHRAAAGQRPRRPPHVRRHRRRHLRHGRRRPDLRSRRPRRRWSTCCSAEQLDMVVGTRRHEEKDAYRGGHVLGNSIFTGLLSGLFGRSFSDIFSGYRVFSRRFVKSFPVLSAGFEIETEMSVHALELQDAGGRGRDELRRAAGGLSVQAIHLFGRLADPEDDRHALSRRAPGALLRQHRSSAGRRRDRSRDSAGRHLSRTPAWCPASRRRSWPPA